MNFDEVIYLEFRLSEQARGCHGVRLWTLYAVPISETLIQLNAGANFFLYCIYNEKFKHELKLQLQKLRSTCCITHMGENNNESTGMSTGTAGVTKNNNSLSRGEAFELNSTSAAVV